MTGRGGSGRIRRKPPTVYDTAPLASPEQRSQQAELQEEEDAAAGGSSRRATKKQKIAAAGRGGDRGAKAAAPAKQGRGRKPRSGGSEEETKQGAKSDEEEEEEEEEGEDAEGEDQDEPVLGKRKKPNRRASAPPAPSAKTKNAAQKAGAKKKGRGRKSTGDIRGKVAAEDQDENEHDKGEEAEVILFGGGPGGGGDAGTENGLLEAVRRNDTALSAVVADWVSTYQEDNGAAMEELLNFILLASGAPATEGPYRPPEGVDVSDMDTDQWLELLEMVTDDMQAAPRLGKAAASFPLAPAAKGKSGKASRIFRSNYLEVFQRLAEACRGSGGDHDVDILEAVILLLVALTQAISADVRLAATLAGMEMGLGIAESLSDLYDKLAVSERQLAGAKSAKGGGKKAAEKSRKVQGLEGQVERISSAVEVLTTASDLVYAKITQKKYRDVSVAVRSAALDGLCKIMLALPDIYVQDKLMRYHGWSLSDKVPAVRVLALQSIQRLLKHEASAVRLDKFSGHFFSRVKTMLRDVDATVNREAAVVLRLMLSAGFLDNMEREDEMDIEAGIFEEGLPLTARTECMGFFVDRLEEFIETDAEKEAAASFSGTGKAAPGKKSKKKKGAGGGADEDEEQIHLVRLESLAQLVSMHAKDGATAATGQAAAAAEDDQFKEQQLLACADFAVQAIWGLPQAPVVRRWGALFKLLDNDESGGDGGGGALDREEQTAVARMVLCSAKMAAVEAATGRRKAGGTLLGKEAKQALRESVADLAEACLTHLPNLLAKYQSDDAKLALLAELPACIPGEALASLVSGAGKAAFSDLLSRMKDAFLMSNSPLVMEAASSSLSCFLNAEHAKKAEVQAMAQGLVEELFSKATALCRKDEKAAGTNARGPASGKRRAWKDTAIALASCFRRLGCLARVMDAGSCVDAPALSEAWDAMEGSVSRRCLLDEVLPPKSLPSQHHERLDAAREVVVEGSQVLYLLFQWQVYPLFQYFRESGAAPDPMITAVEGGGGGGGGDEDGSAADGEAVPDGENVAEPTPLKSRGKKGSKSKGKGKGGNGGNDEGEDKDEDALGGGSALEVEEVKEDRVQVVVRYRDSLVEVLRAMLAMHLYPRRDEDEGEENEHREKTGEGGDRGLLQDGTEGVPRVLTPDQKTRLVGPARLTAWRLSNELRTILKELLQEADGAYASLSWLPDVPFTCLLQEHFEEMERAMLGAASKAGGQRKSSSKNGPKNGPKVELGDGDEDSSDDSDPDDADLDLEPGPQGGLMAKEDMGRYAGELLMPLMKSIYSNADKLNRRQAAAVVAHLVRPDKMGGGFAKCFVSKLREHSPIKCLEVHMATLRVFYDKWVVAIAATGNDDDDDDDDDDADGDGDGDGHLDDKKMRKQWEQDQAGMDRWLPLARRLSMSLGVGPLRSKGPAEQKTLQDLFLGFMKVGVRFALDPEGDRLLFLEGIKEYASKVTPRQKKILGKAFDDEAKRLHDSVLEEGRDFASVWDSGDPQQQQHDVAPRWRAFFSFRNTLSPGSAVSFVPDITSNSNSNGSEYGSGGDVLTLSPPSSINGSSVGTRTPAHVAWRTSSITASSTSGGSGGSAKRPGRATGRTASARSVGRMSMTSAGSDLLPVAEEGLFQDDDEEEEPGGGNAGSDEAGESRSVVSEVHTPNKRRLGASERLRESEQEQEEEEQEDLLLGGDMVLNPSDAAPPAGAGKANSNKRRRRVAS
eukprot:g6471.t2